jgi:hypothetical protein
LSSPHFSIVHAQSAFESFFSSLPDHLRARIGSGTFHDFVEADRIEKEFDTPIIREKKEFGSWKIYSFDPACRMGMFAIVDNNTVQLPRLLRKVFLPWLPKCISRN